MIHRFVREECGEAAYKLWKGLVSGAKDENAVALRTRRAFEQFLVRARGYGYRDDEIEDLRRFFDLHYWPMEEAWLAHRQSVAERRKLFAELGGPQAVAAIKSDVQTFYEWSRAVIGEAYTANDYQRALRVCDAVVAEAASIVARDFDDQDFVLGLCAVQEAACVATMVRLNCWASEPSGFLSGLDHILRKRVTAAMLSGTDRPALGRFTTIATMLKAACGRFERADSMEASLHAIYSMLGYIRFHQGIRARVADETQSAVDSMTVTLMLSEVVSRRADWLRTFGLYGRMREVPDFESKASAQLSDVLGDEEEPGLIDATLAFMGEPHQLIESEWADTERGVASTTSWNDVALAVLGAKVWLQQDVIDLGNSHAWLGRAKGRLDGCGVHLAWSDFYCVCDAYMQERGNPTLCDYALNSVRKLQRTAGNSAAVEHFETGILEIASRRKSKPPASQNPDDMDLQWFLREEPASLSARR